MSALEERTQPVQSNPAACVAYRRGAWWLGCAVVILAASFWGTSGMVPVVVFAVAAARLGWHSVRNSDRYALARERVDPVTPPLSVWARARADERLQGRRS